MSVTLVLHCVSHTHTHIYTHTHTHAFTLTHTHSHAHIHTYTHAPQRAPFLQIGKFIVDNLQAHARVRCGFASVKDVRTLQLEDQMDSFVLAETFKLVAPCDVNWRVYANCVWRVRVCVLCGVM